MSDEESNDVPWRLDAIETQWSLVREAHQIHTSQHGESATSARQALVLRYAVAIRKFVSVMLRDPADVDEVSQDVVLKLMQGDFFRATPSRGRFRDFLKTATRNAVKNFWATRTRRREVDLDPSQPPLSDDSDQLDQLWIRSVRDNILQIAWDRLERYEKEVDGNVSFQVLRIRTNHPDLTTEEVATKLSNLVQREIPANTVRQQIRRARIRFAQFLVEEIAHGLDNCKQESIQNELTELGLLDHIKGVLPRTPLRSIEPERLVKSI